VKWRRPARLREYRKFEVEHVSDNLMSECTQDQPKNKINIILLILTISRKLAIDCAGQDAEIRACGV